MVKNYTIHRKVIHKDLHYILNKVGEDSHHVSLKCGGGIRQPKWHSPISKCTLRTGKGGLFSAIKVDRDSEKPRVPV